MHRRRWSPRCRRRPSPLKSADVDLARVNEPVAKLVPGSKPLLRGVAEIELDEACRSRRPPRRRYRPSLLKSPAPIALALAVEPSCDSMRQSAAGLLDQDLHVRPAGRTWRPQDRNGRRRCSRPTAAKLGPGPDPEVDRCRLRRTRRRLAHVEVDVARRAVERGDVRTTVAGEVGRVDAVGVGAGRRTAAPPARRLPRRSRRAAPDQSRRTAVQERFIGLILSQSNEI